jgi:hypothetical protein
MRTAKAESFRYFALTLRSVGKLHVASSHVSELCFNLPNTLHVLQGHSLTCKGTQLRQDRSAISITWEVSQYHDCRVQSCMDDHMMLDAGT